MAALLQDLRYGLRLLTRHPGFSLLGVVVLAFGIGANTAVFSLINGMVLKPRPGVPDAELAGVYSRDRTQPDSYRAFSYPNYLDLRGRQNLFVSLAAHTFTLVGLSEGDAMRRIFVDVVSSNYFDTFGVPLARGRAFTAEEERPGADIPVAILSHATWKRLGGRDDVVGSTLKMNGRLFTVVGVAAKGFGGSMSIASPELWLPLGVYDRISNNFLREGLPETLADRRHHTLILVARLPPRTMLESLTAPLEAESGRMERAYPAENEHQTLSVARLSRMSVSTSPESDSEIGTLAVLLFSMSGLVLLVASFNLANMLLARGSARHKEFAIRLAIGGSRARIVRQLVTESVVLALAGGVAATFVAWWATRAIAATLAPRLPVVITLDTTPDVRILGVTVGLCVVSALCFGLGPAWRHARTDTLPELKDQAGEPSGGRRSPFAARNLLVMGQLALSLVTLTAAGLFMRAALQSAVADPGFTLERGIMANVDPSLVGRSREETHRFYEQAVGRLRAMPGVDSVSLGSIMPFGEFTEGRAVQKAGAPLRRGDGSSSAMGAGGGDASDEPVPGLIDAITTVIGRDYFKTMGLSVTRGREFTAGEEMAASDARVAIIDETLAARLFKSEDPLGRLVQWQAGPQAVPTVARVIGVVAPSRHQLLEHRMRAHIYTAFGQDFRTSMFLHVRTNAPTAAAEAAMLPAVRQALLAIDPQLPIIALETRPMFRERNFVLWTLRAGANLFVAFGALALFMAVVGVYGVKAYVVARRTREIGIRVSLGATPRDVIAMVVRDGLITSVAGLAAGLALSVLACGLIRNLLFGDARLDVPVIAGAAVALSAAAILASWLPARRAARVAPTLALRSE